MTARMFGDARDWFCEKRFGLFLHWGLYSIPAWHEQMQMRKRIPRAEYEKLALAFNPVNYDPDQWLDAAEKAGMEYLCFTTKHHDGFCLWDTAETDYNVMNTPYGRDTLKELSAACHRRGVPLCLYYSVVDWHHANYPNKNASHELEKSEPGDVPDLDKYMAFLKAQIEELCANYGRIHGIWWDMNQTGLVDPSINEMIRKLQPGAVINNRGFDEGDFGTPERDYEGALNEAAVFEEPTEYCQSVGSESWGYRKNEDYFTPAYLIRSVDKMMARNGNVLLNVGPRADGSLPDDGVEILSEIGKWYHPVKESFEYGKAVNLGLKQRGTYLVLRQNSLYVHLNEANCSKVSLRPLNIAPESATLLNDNSPVAFQLDYFPMTYPDSRPYLNLTQLPVKKYGDSVMVVKLEFGDRESSEIERMLKETL